MGLEKAVTVDDCTCDCCDHASQRQMAEMEGVLAYLVAQTDELKRKAKELQHIAFRQELAKAKRN